MKNLQRILLIGLFAFIAIHASAQRKVDIVKFDWYKHLRSIENDTTYVLNFWASWCMPCIAELPEFEKLNQTVQGQKVKVILVNLDSYKKLQITVIPYLDKEQIQSEVVVLDEPNFNKWINKVDRSWSGSIPATVIFNHQNKLYKFIEGETTFSELSAIIDNAEEVK